MLKKPLRVLSYQFVEKRPEAVILSPFAALRVNSAKNLLLLF
jgi:hypothetical protein